MVKYNNKMMRKINKFGNASSATIRTRSALMKKKSLSKRLSTTFSRLLLRSRIKKSWERRIFLLSSLWISPGQCAYLHPFKANINLRVIKPRSYKNSKSSVMALTNSYKVRDKSLM